VPGQTEELVKKIMDELGRSDDVDSAVSNVRRSLNTIMPGLADQLANELEEAREIVLKEFEKIQVLHNHSVIRKRPQWYFGPTPTDRHWPLLREYLISKNWDPEDVAEIDRVSNEVVSLLENPKQEQFAGRGLVVGHVQSGKTANMTAVMAKALDAGYDTVIVLAGLTNKLRYQTQNRMFKDLVMRRPFDWQLQWQVLTPSEQDRDFKAPAQGGFLVHDNKAQLAVVKKNVSPLGQLNLAIDNTQKPVLRRLRILVIDDECDQASVNSASRELDMTAINQAIRVLLKMMPAVSYVGYTATPFANVLSDPYRQDEVEGEKIDDLYPRDFITALPASPNYFGAEKLFGRAPADADDLSAEEEGLDMIREVPEKEQALLQPAKASERDTFFPALTPTLETAILYFLACCAVRRARGDGDEHMTMLVHTSAFVLMHERVAELIEAWVNLHRSEIADPNSAFGQRLASIWNKERGRLPADITAARDVSIDEIFEHIPQVLERLEFPIENGSSDDRIDYDEKNPRTYIVVGGSILARGLTLEGLMVSYFLRTANQYDTLLQMGRWFGYRENYEDLPRIWMPDALKRNFRNLALVEHEIRNDIERYRLEELTPMDIAVRIRSIPGMAITSSAKMRAARKCAISYWGTHRQTFRFEHQNRDLLRANWKAAADLLTAATKLGLQDRSGDRKLWVRVPKNLIISFLEKYRVSKSHTDMDPGVLLPFIRKSDERLLLWNVGIVESGRGDPSELELGPAGILKTVNRARLDDGKAPADIKALMSKSDLKFDWTSDPPADGDWDDLKLQRRKAVGEVPLLLLYPIDRNSKPERESKVRVPLDAAADVLGYGIVFPGSVTDGADFVSVDLQPISADEIEAIEAEEAAQAEAAGV